MKRLFGYLAVMCAAMIVLLSFAGCNGGNDNNEVNLIGNWKIALNEDGISYKQAKLYRPFVEEIDGKLEFKSEGKVKISGKVGAEDKSGEGTWSVEGDKVTISDPTGALGAVGTVTFTYKDGKLLSDSQEYVCLVRS